MVIDWRSPCYRASWWLALLGGLDFSSEFKGYPQNSKNQGSFMGTQAVSRKVTQGPLLRRNLI